MTCLMVMCDDDGDDVLYEQCVTSSRWCAVCPNPRGRVPGVERRAGLAVAKLQLQLLGYEGAE